MTLRKLYSELSKIIDKECETSPGILDKPVILSIIPCSTNDSDLIRCGNYGVVNIINDKEVITIINYGK